MEILEQIAKTIDGKLGLNTNDLNQKMNDKVSIQGDKFIKVLDEKINSITKQMEEILKKKSDDL